LRPPSATRCSVIGRKHDATGRSSGHFANSKLRKANRPPVGEPFVWFTKQMLESPAYRVLSGGAEKVIARIAIEHMGHGGGLNGALPVTHNNFANYGIRRASILAFLSEAVVLGFVDRTQQGQRRYGDFEGAPALYRLTWLPTHDGKPASNDWELFESIEDAKRAVAGIRSEIKTKRLRCRTENPTNRRKPPIRNAAYKVAAE
jgi:hypothetical protein